MAEPIALKLAPRDPREALYHRLENAPREHVEALLASYEVLQGLQDRELLEALAQAVPEGLAQAKMPEPFGLWQLLKKLSSRDTRRVMTAMTCVLESLGKAGVGLSTSLPRKAQT
jgi:uncharacterized protein YjgD (DUF1641 family)